MNGKFVNTNKNKIEKFKKKKKIIYIPVLTDMFWLTPTLKKHQFSSSNSDPCKAMSFHCSH